MYDKREDGSTPSGQPSTRSGWRPTGQLTTHTSREGLSPPYTKYSSNRVHDSSKVISIAQHQSWPQTSSTHQAVQSGQSQEQCGDSHTKHDCEDWPALANASRDTTTLLSLPKLVAIPAVAPALGSPFLRAYPTVLDSFQISREQFLGFLDGLNRVAVKSPPLQVLGLVGSMVGFVPLATAQIVSASVNAAATLGTIAMSKGATEIYLRKANRELFAPCGLKVQVAKLKAVARLAGIPILDSTGKIKEDAQLLEPILPSGEETTSTVRWLAALQPWIANVELEDLPQINLDTNFFGKLHTMASERERKQSEKKMRDSRRKAHEKREEGEQKANKDREKDLRKLDREEAKTRRREHGGKLEKELRKVEQERQKVEMKFEKETKKTNKDVKKEDKESRGLRTVLWIIIEDIGSGEKCGDRL